MGWTRSINGVDDIWFNGSEVVNNNIIYYFKYEYIRRKIEKKKPIEKWG